MNPRRVAGTAVVFVVALVTLTFVFGALFGSTGLGVGPAIAVAVGMAAAVWFATRPSTR